MTRMIVFSIILVTRMIVFAENLIVFVLFLLEASRALLTEVNATLTARSRLFPATIPDRARFRVWKTNPYYVYKQASP